VEGRFRRNRRAVGRDCCETHTPNQHFVATTLPPRTIATFLPYSQHFVAHLPGATTIETKRWLPGRPT
jgi:hypothetical protein